jgi:hypothetical protein
MWQEVVSPGVSTYCIVGCLEEVENDVVKPELPHVVILDLVRPDAEHTIERNEHAEEVGHLEHTFCGTGVELAARLVRWKKQIFTCSTASGDTKPPVLQFPITGG